jgi:hypothetical protein
MNSGTASGRGRGLIYLSSSARRYADNPEPAITVFHRGA